MENNRGRVRIGTSNVVIPGNKSTFPPEFQSTSRLRYYSSIFDTVEVNSCFYKTPMHSTYEKWTMDVPADFQFSLKLTRDITHAKNLEGDFTCMNKFMSTAKGTGAKKGCLLIQFPGKITLDYFNQVEEILEELRTLDHENEWRKAVEFRNPSWYAGETYELLEQYGASLVLHDIPKAWVFDPGNAKFIYIRFHGPKGDYRDSYSPAFLTEKAAQITSWLDQDKDVFVYFNNTIGNAYENALSLKSLLGQ